MHIQKCLLFALLLFVGACSKDDDTSITPGGTLPVSGQWKVTYFFDKKDETSYFLNYTFDFGSNNSLTAKNGSNTWGGTWRTGTDDSKNKLVIDFVGSSPSVLSELEEDWIVISITDTFMHLEHTSGGGGDTDVVHFKKM